MPSRQERRKAERDAAKRAPGQAGAEGAGGAGGAAATLANLNVNANPVGDWTTQTADPHVWSGGYCLARHVFGRRSTQETRIQSVVNDVSSDLCLARPFDAVCRARSRDREAEGCCG